MRPLVRQYPAIIEAALTRHLRAAETLEIMPELEKAGKLIVLEPESTFGMDTLTLDKNAMYKMYANGYQQTLELLKREPGFFRR